METWNLWALYSQQAVKRFARKTGLISFIFQEEKAERRRYARHAELSVKHSTSEKLIHGDECDRLAGRLH